MATIQKILRIVFNEDKEKYSVLTNKGMLTLYVDADKVYVAGYDFDNWTDTYSEIDLKQFLEKIFNS